MGTALSGNLIYDSNKIMISAECRELGAEMSDLGIAKDNAVEITTKIKIALETLGCINHHWRHKRWRVRLSS